MSVMDLQFQHQAWLFAALPIAAAVFLLFRWGNRRRRAGLDALLSRGLHQRFTAQVASGRRRLKQWMLILAAALLAVGLARPQLGYNWEESLLETTDLLIALDTSRSMLAPDLKPNRLARAKLEIESFVKRLQGVRIGLIPFAGDAFLWCPLTYDTETFLDSLRSAEVGIIPTGGTQLLSAVETAERSFLGQEGGTKIMVLITDGENLQGQIEERLPSFSRKGWVIHTIGIGTEEGELIPIQREDGGTSFVTDADGNVVKSKLDAATLQTIATQTGGTYHTLGPGGQGLYDLYDNVLRAQLEAREESRIRKIPIERYAWITALLLLLLFMEPLIRDRRNVGRRASNAMLFLLTLGLIGAGFSPAPASASPARQAQKAYVQGDFSSAEEGYQAAVQQEPDRWPMHYNLGVSALQNQNFSVAKQAFDAALQSADLELQHSAYYNRANTLYHLGQRQLDGDPQQTVAHWEQAIADYERALALQPEDAEAQANKTEVERLLERLKELLQQQNSPESSNDGQDSDESQDNGQDSQDPTKDSNSDSDSQDDPNDASSGNESTPDSQDAGSEEPKSPSPPDEGNAETKPEPAAGETMPEEQTGSDATDPSESNPESPEPGEAATSAEAAAAEANGGEASPDPREQEALRLLDSLKQEDGDTPQLLFRMQNPAAEDDSPEMDW